VTQPGRGVEVLVGVGEGVKEAVEVLLFVGTRLGIGVSVGASSINVAVAFGKDVPHAERASARVTRASDKILVLENGFMG